jgi:2-methylcitrate dehydratase PrpD
MPKDNTTVQTIDRFAEWIASIRSDQISASARNAARLAVLDVVGVAIAAAREPAPRATAAWAQTTFPEGKASIWFTGKSGSVLAAALANSAAGSAADGDDTHWPSWMHSGSSIVPAALAEAEATGASWDELLEAVVIGYEVTCRIAAAVDWPVLVQIATGHWCGFGAAAAVARLRGQSGADLAKAFAVVMGLRPYVYVPDDGLNLNGIKEGVSWATFTGISALELSGLGLTGPHHGLDHSLFDQARIMDMTRKAWAIEEASLKPSASCAWTHAPVEAFLKIVSKHGLAASDISKVVVTTFPQAVTYINNEADPQTLEAGQYNIIFNVAVAAIDGEQAFFPLSSSALHRKEVIDFGHRVELVANEEYERSLPEKHAVHVRVKSSKGDFDQYLDSESNPHDWATVVDKFLKMTARSIPAADQQKIIGLVGETGDVATLCAFLREPIVG